MMFYSIFIGFLGYFPKSVSPLTVTQREAARAETTRPSILFFPQTSNLRDFPKIYLLFIIVFINMIFILKLFVLLFLQYRYVFYIRRHFILDNN